MLVLHLDIKQTFYEMAGSFIMLVAKFDIILIEGCIVLTEESFSTHLLVVPRQVCPEYQLALVFA